MTNQTIWRWKKVCTDFTKVENHDKALADNYEGWVLHHKLGVGVPYEELIELNLYYNRPPHELVFVTKKEHRGIHNKGMEHKDSWRKKQSSSKKGVKKSERQKQRMREAALRRWKNDEERARQSERIKAIATPERNSRISKAKTGKIWWTNGHEEKCQKEPPDGNWLRGRSYLK